MMWIYQNVMEPLHSGKVLSVTPPCLWACSQYALSHCALIELSHVTLPHHTVQKYGQSVDTFVQQFCRGNILCRTNFIFRPFHHGLRSYRSENVIKFWDYELTQITACVHLDKRQEPKGDHTICRKVFHICYFAKL